MPFGRVTIDAHVDIPVLTRSAIDAPLARQEVLASIPCRSRGCRVLYFSRPGHVVPRHNTLTHGRTAIRGCIRHDARGFHAGYKALDVQYLDEKPRHRYANSAGLDLRSTDWLADGRLIRHKFVSRVLGNHGFGRSPRRLLLKDWHTAAQSGPCSIVEA